MLVFSNDRLSPFFLLSWFVTIALPWASKMPIKVKPYCLRLSPSWSYFSSAACFQHRPESVCWFARVCARRAPNNACFTVGLCLPGEESSHITLIQILFFLHLKKTLLLKFTLLTILASNCYLSKKQEAWFLGLMRLYWNHVDAIMVELISIYSYSYSWS